MLWNAPDNDIVWYKTLCLPHGVSVDDPDGMDYLGGYPR